MFEQDPRHEQKPLSDLPVFGQNSQPRLNHSRWVVLGFYVGLSSLSGCTFSSSASQSLPPVAAETPSIGTASPVVDPPNLRWGDLIGVCEGQEATAAQPYQASVNSGDREIVFVHRDVSRDENYDLYDSHLLTRTWQPTQPEKARLVVCISENKRFELIESCSYKNGRHTLHRYRNTIEVELREANTGETLDTATFNSEAWDCPSQKPIGDEAAWNWSGQLPDAELYAWLKPYLNLTTTEDIPGRDRPPRKPMAHSASIQ